MINPKTTAPIAENGHRRLFWLDQPSSFFGPIFLQDEVKDSWGTMASRPPPLRRLGPALSGSWPPMKTRIAQYSWEVVWPDGRQHSLSIIIVYVCLKGRFLVLFTQWPSRQTVESIDRTQLRTRTRVCVLGIFSFTLPLLFINRNHGHRLQHVRYGCMCVYVYTKRSQSVQHVSTLPHSTLSAANNNNRKSIAPDIYHVQAL